VERRTPKRLYVNCAQIRNLSGIVIVATKWHALGLPRLFNSLRVKARMRLRLACNSNCDFLVKRVRLRCLQAAEILQLRFPRAFAFNSKLGKGSKNDPRDVYRKIALIVIAIRR